MLKLAIHGIPIILIKSIGRDLKLKLKKNNDNNNNDYNNNKNTSIGRIYICDKTLP